MKLFYKNIICVIALMNIGFAAICQSKTVTKKPATVVKEYAVSQYQRSNGGGTETNRPGYADSKVMGYSIRNQQYRFTLCMGENYRSTQPFNKDFVISIELYDYKKDPLETNNVAADKNYEAISKKLNT